MQTANPELVDVELVTVPAGRRSQDNDAVKRIAKSIEEIGLRTPITVLSVNEGERLDLVAGQHRLAAVRKLGWPSVSAFVIEGNTIEAQMWEIAENLHRAELTALERSEQIAKWIELCKAKAAHNAHPGGKQPTERGVSKAAKELGVSRRDVERAAKVADLSDEAKEAARDSGLDNNRAALLKAAVLPNGMQAANIREQAESKRVHMDRDVKERAAAEVAEIIIEHVPGDVLAMLKANLIAAGAHNISNAITEHLKRSGL